MAEYPWAHETPEQTSAVRREFIAESDATKQAREAHRKANFAQLKREQMQETLDKLRGKMSQSDSNAARRSLVYDPGDVAAYPEDRDKWGMGDRQTIVHSDGSTEHSFLPRGEDGELLRVVPPWHGQTVAQDEEEAEAETITRLLWDQKIDSIMAGNTAGGRVETYVDGSKEWVPNLPDGTPQATTGEVFYDPNDPAKGGTAIGAAKGGYQKERSMPSKSPEQSALMRAVAHGWKPSRMKGPSRRVAKEFMRADQKAKKFQYGGYTGEPENFGLEDMSFMDTYADAAPWQPPQVTQPTAPLYETSWPSGEPEGGSFYEEDPGAPIFPGDPGGGGPALPPVTTPPESTILGGQPPPPVATPPPVVAPPPPPVDPVGGGSRSYAQPSRYSEQAAAHQARIRAMIGAGGAARGGPVRMQGGGRIPQQPGRMPPQAGGLGQFAQRGRAPGVGTRPPTRPGGRPQSIGPGGGTGMPQGGAPPSLRGHLQAMRAQQRQTPGGNRVGMRDQQGGLARAMQTQTGRPPISRRAAFPGSRQNQY